MLTVKQFTFNPLQENTYIVYNEHGHCIIVDPGCYFPEECNEMKNYIEQQQLSPKTLLNTHCHLDHIFGNAFIHERYGLPLHLHRNEKTVLEHGPATGKMYGLPFINYSGELIYIDEKDTITLGEESLRILFTPGHSPGSLSFYNAEHKFVLSGDVLFRESIGRTDLPGGNFETLIDSIQTMLWPLPDDVVVYSGHGPETTIGYEKAANPFLKNR